MSEGYNFERLKSEILPLSAATDWETARKEWSLVNIYESDEPQSCLCGHYPIIEICKIHNGTTGNSAEVGNQCVKRFLGMRSDLIFTAVKRIRTDNEKSLNSDAIAFFYRRNAITKWEFEFLQDTMRKRNLSNKQMSTRVNINRKLLAQVQRRGFQGPD